MILRALHIIGWGFFPIGAYYWATTDDTGAAFACGIGLCCLLDDARDWAIARLERRAE